MTQERGNVFSDGEADLIQILIVCVANACRSPITHRELAARLDRKSYSIDSAGTRAEPGMPLIPPAKAWCVKRGYDSTWSAKSVSNESVLRANLIITMTREERRWIAEYEPTAAYRTFTLREFAFVASELPSTLTPLELIHTASRMRGWIVSGHPNLELDIPDPVLSRPGRKGNLVYQRTFDDIRRQVKTISVLFSR